jgi:hypothetical protein
VIGGYLKLIGNLPIIETASVRAKLPERSE